MIFPFTAAVFLFFLLGVAVFAALKIIKKRRAANEVKNLGHTNYDIVKVLLSLEKEPLARLFELYGETYGKGAAKYAKKTYRKWQKGEVRPNPQTLYRFLFNLPKVMSYDLKCEILRHLMVEYGKKSDYEIKVYTDDWKEVVNPLLKKIIEDIYNTRLPDKVAEKLKWLSEGEMHSAEEILRLSQTGELQNVYMLLENEIADIEKLLAQKHLNPKVTHRIKFPYGIISLQIKKR